MLSMDVFYLFEKLDEEYSEFERVLTPTHPHKDVCAYVLLSEIERRAGKGYGRVICAAEHDEIYFGVSLQDLSEHATDDEVLTLIRCGVRLGDTCLCMYV